MTLKIRPGFEQWDPSLITTALWLDAADTATLFTTNSGSTLATDGSEVGRWEDKSGNSRHFTNSTSASRPTKSVNSVDFDGIDDFLSRSLTLSQPFGVYIVCKLLTRSASGQKYIFGIGDTFDFASNTNSQVRIFAPTQLTASDSTQTSDSIYSLTYNGASSRIAKNGSTLATGNTGTNSLNGTCRLASYAGNNDLYNSNVKFYELILVSESTANPKMEGYLAHKWGLTANLPNDHPHKTNAPAP